MPNFTVMVRVEATDGDAVLTRIADSWGLVAETEGVMSITQQPDSVAVPPDMQPPADLPPDVPPEEPPPPPEEP